MLVGRAVAAGADHRAGRSVAVNSVAVLIIGRAIVADNSVAVPGQPRQAGDMDIRPLDVDDQAAVEGYYELTRLTWAADVRTFRPRAARGLSPTCTIRGPGMSTCTCWPGSITG